MTYVLTTTLSSSPLIKVAAHVSWTPPFMSIIIMLSRSHHKHKAIKVILIQPKLLEMMPYLLLASFVASIEQIAVPDNIWLHWILHTFPIFYNNSKSNTPYLSILLADAIGHSTFYLLLPSLIKFCTNFTKILPKFTYFNPFSPCQQNLYWLSISIASIKSIYLTFP